MRSQRLVLIVSIAALTTSGAVACGGEMDPSVANPIPYESPAPAEPAAPATPATPSDPPTTPPADPTPAAPTCPPDGRSNLEAGFCSADCPCDVDQGGCASDDHCKGDLICATEAEHGWLRRCVEAVAIEEGPKADGSPCIDDGDCQSNNCGCDRFSNIFTCLPAHQTSSCITSSFQCDSSEKSDHGASCAGVVPETWRCVQSAAKFPGESLSQVCRGGVWQSYHRNPRDCDACCGDYSSACAHL